MPYYAQLTDGVVTAVTETSEALPPAAHLIEIDGLRFELLGMKREGGEFVPVVVPPVVPPWAWYIDHGPFTDRLGGAATVTIDTSTAAGFVAIRADFARRKWIDLKDPRVVATVGYLAGQPLPGLGTLATPLLTAAQADAVLNTPVTQAENLALRKLYFS